MKITETFQKAPVYVSESSDYCVAYARKLVDANLIELLVSGDGCVYDFWLQNCADEITVDLSEHKDVVDKVESQLGEHALFVGAFGDNIIAYTMDDLEFSLDDTKCFNGYEVIDAEEICEGGEYEELMVMFPYINAE